MKPSEPTVEADTIFVSASQLSTFKDCPRKWAYDKLDSVPRLDTDATNEGKAIHTELEDWFKHGTPVTRPEAVALLQHLPERGDHLLVEHSFEFAWPGIPVMAHGFIDLVDPLEGVTYDHKTTKNLKRYAKSKETLRLDAQSILYGVASRLVQYRDEVKLQWNYVQREQPKDRLPLTDPVAQVQTLTDVEEGLHYWAPTVERIYQIRKRGGKAVEVEPNQDACYAYGPCQYRDLCPDFKGGSKKPPQDEGPPVSLAHLARLQAASKPALVVESSPVASAPDNLPDPVLATDAPKQTPLLDTLRIDFKAAPNVVPPDAQPNVSVLEPPVPPQPEPKPEAAPKAKRGRPRKDASLTEIAATVTDPSDPVPGFNLEAFIESAVEEASKSKDDILVKLEAARIALDLLNFRKGK